MAWLAGMLTHTCMNRGIAREGRVTAPAPVGLRPYETSRLSLFCEECLRVKHKHLMANMVSFMLWCCCFHCVHLLLQLYILTLSLVRVDVGSLVSGSMSVYPLVTLLLIRTGQSVSQGPTTARLAAAPERTAQKKWHAWLARWADTTWPGAVFPKRRSH